MLIIPRIFRPRRREHVREGEDVYPRSRSFIACLLLAALLAGCSISSQSSSGDVGDPRTVIIPAGVEPALSVMLPKGFTSERLQGTDSQVARIRGPDLIVNVDYGEYSGPQTCGSTINCREGNASVTGRSITWIIVAKPVSVDGVNYREQLHLYVPVAADGLRHGGVTGGVRYDAACATSCALAKQIGLSTAFGR